MVPSSWKPRRFAPTGEDGRPRGEGHTPFGKAMSAPGLGMELACAQVYLSAAMLDDFSDVTSHPVSLAPMSEI
jgi:hypothetical protein